ncbi:unnamed protein product, partial [Gulo gulo]
ALPETPSLRPSPSPATLRPQRKVGEPGDRASRTPLEAGGRPWPLEAGSGRLGMGSPAQVRPWPSWPGSWIVSGSPVSPHFQGPPIQSHRASSRTVKRLRGGPQATVGTPR